MASEKADAWMPLYVTDYLGDTMHLTTEQHGAYMLLLMACWKGDGRIPNEDGRLAAITKLPVKRWKLHRLTLLKFFTIADDFISHKRVLKEREKAKEISAERRESGKKGAAKRWQTDSNCHGSANGKPVANDQQTGRQIDAPSPSHVTTSEANASGADAPVDPIWGTGLAFLVRKGVPEKAARSLLGKLKREAGDIEAGALLAKADTEDITDPIPWLMAAAVAARERKRAPQQSKARTVIDQFEALKHGLANDRTADRLPEVALLGFGSDPGE